MLRMSILCHKTVSKEINIDGIGLHTGNKVKLKILPSAPNTGILFKRSDVKNTINTVIPNFYNVSDTNLCTTISNEHGVKVSTIEHLMAALYGLGIDNAIVELNNQEVPILDGSAKGGSLENAIVVDNMKILNKSGLRNKKEFVNHKILDCMGDLYLSGFRIVGSINCSQGGHSLTNKILRKLFEDKSNYSLIELKGNNLPHTLIEKFRLKSIA